MMDKELWQELTIRAVIALIVLYLVLPVVFVWGGYPMAACGVIA